MDGAHPNPRVCWCVRAIHVAGTIKDGPAWIQYSACRRTLLGFTGGHGTLPGWYPDGTLYSWLLNGSSSYGNFITWLPISHWNKKGMILLWPSTTSDLKHACGWHRAFTWHVSGLRRTNRNNIWENMWWPLHCHNSASSQPLFHPHSSPVLLGSEVTTPISLVKSKKGVFTIQIHAPNLNLG